MPEAADDTGLPPADDTADTVDAAGIVARLRGVGYRYKGADTDAVHGVDLTLLAGGITALLGPTGAGKSTLCLLLGGAAPHLLGGALTGELQVAGVSSGELGPDEVGRLTRHVAGVFQNPQSQLFGLTVEEDVAFGPENLLVEPAEIDRLIDEVLATVGLVGFRGRSPFRLSGGQQQRVAIAAALAMRPRLLVLDEPVSELDPAGKDDVLRVVAGLVAGVGAGFDTAADRPAMAVVLADHDAERVVAIASRVVVLAGGRVVAHGPVAEVFADPGRLRAVGVRVPAVVELTDRLRVAGLLDRVETDERAAVDRIAALVSSGVLRPAAAAPVHPVGAGGPAAAGPPAVELRSVRFGYPDAGPVLHDVDLVVPAGDYLALVGHNGSGKTTLAKHLNAVLRPSSGRVLLGGEDVSTMTAAQTARRVGYVYQNPDQQIFARTVGDEVAFGPRNLGMSEPAVRAAVAEALEFVGLAGQESAEPFFLGLGRRQRLAVASVLAMAPQVLVVDEPDTGQDGAGAEEMMRLVDRLHATGRTVVVVSHTMDLVARHARRVVAMAGGRIVLDAPTRDFFGSADALAALALAAPQITRICAALGSPRPLLTVDEALAWLGVEPSCPC